MPRIDRLVTIACLVIVALGAATLVLAQPNPVPPPPPASAPVLPPTAADITAGSPCGAPGVGKVMQGERRNQIERRAGANGQWVDTRGYWSSRCPKPGPGACAAQGVEPWGTKGACAPVGNAQGRLPASNLGDQWRVRTRAGSQPKGEQLYECKGAGWTLVSSDCNR